MGKLFDGTNSEHKYASNPEVVAPLDKLKGMINNNGGGGGKIEVFGRISGNDIFLSNQKSTNSRFRSV